MRPLLPLTVTVLGIAVPAPRTGAAQEPPTAPRDSAQAGPAALPNTVEQDGVEVSFVDRVPADKARLILAEALRARAAIEEYFGTSLDSISIRVSQERRIPFASRGTIYLPADRIDRVTPDWDYDPMSITHEMTHLLGRGYRPDRMLVEGLAVYVNDRVGRPTYPNDGKDLHAATLQMQGELGRTIPLLESERYRRRGSREERRLAYTQEGSFARYYIERYGLQAFLDLALEDAPYADQAQLWQRLETEWRASLAASD